MFLTISKRLALMSLIGLLAVLSVGAVGIVQMGRIKAELDQVQQRYIPAMQACFQASLNFSNLRRGSVLYTNAASDQVRAIGRQQFTDAIAKQRERVAELQHVLIGLDKEKEFEEQEERLFTQYLQMSEKLIADIEVPGSDRGKLVETALKELTPVGANVSKTLDAHSRFYADLLAQSTERSAQRYRSAQWTIIACTLVGLGLLSAWGWGVYQRVVKPLASVRDIVTKVEADKDFRTQATVTGRDEVSQVLLAFNRLLNAMKSAIQGMSISADGVGKTAHMLQGTSDALSQQVTTQSEAASTIAAAMEEMTVSVSIVATQASDAKQASAQAGEMANNSAEVILHTAQEIDRIADAVKLSASLMNELEEHSQRINSVVSVIREVAEQTNLLALNAAIEAARAGEQGRGFAVVADEVRKLAERTSVSTREIATTVASIQSSTAQVRSSMQEAVGSVERGVVRARDASAAIGKVSTHAAHAMQLVTDISGAISEQSAALTEIAKQIEVIARMSEENHTTAKTSASEAAELDKVASDLQQTASQYRI